MPRTVLQLVNVSDGREVGRFTLQPDGHVVTEGGGAAGILRALLREEFHTEREAFEFLDRRGWTNGNSMVKLDE